MRNKEELLTQEIVRELLDYDAETGVVRWKWRDIQHFKTPTVWKAWNSRLAGKRVGSNHSSGYYNVCMTINNKKRTCLLHRIIWLLVTGEFPNNIDHINGNKKDNRWENLRDVTYQTNNMNKRKGKNNKSGINGVCFNKKQGKWHAYVRRNYLGSFDTIEEAETVVLEKRKELGFTDRHGE